MDDTCTRLVEFSLGDPHSVEGGQCCVDGASKPGRVLAFGVLDDLRAVVVGSQSIDLAPQSLRNVCEQSVTASNHDVLEHVSSDTFVAFHDRVVDVFLDAFFSDICPSRNLGLEKNLRAAETLFTEDNFASIR